VGQDGLESWLGMLRKSCLLSVFAILCVVNWVLRLWEDIIESVKLVFLLGKRRQRSAELPEGFHVAICCEDEYLSSRNIVRTIQKLAELSVWLAEEGVKTITICDTCGKLRSLVDGLTEAIKEEKHNVKIVVDVDKRSEKSNHGASRVRVASAINGRTAVVEYAKRIASRELLTKKEGVQVQGDSLFPPNHQLL